MRKKLLSLSLVLALCLSLCACASSTPTEIDTTTKFTSEGFTLSVPNEYADLLIVDTTVTEGPRSTFFSVHEKASADASKALWPNDETMVGGFLFGIGRVDETTFRDMMIWGMNGADVFARDKDNNYYIRYHPTDVQLIREGEYTDADWEQWKELGQWVSGAVDAFVAENPNLTSYHRTYKDIDCALHYIAYGEGSAQLTSYGDAFYTPERSEYLPYVEQLLDDVLYFDYLSGELNTEGNYITLLAPDMFQYTSFDFFTDEGQQQYIRQNFSDIEPIYYVAAKNGKEFPVGQVVADWLSTLDPAPISDLEFALRRLSYLNIDEFELTRIQSGAVVDRLTPSKDLSRPYMKQLMNGTLTDASAEKIPDCEYISLWLPDMGLRFDFFLADSEQGTYVLRTQHGGFEDLFLLTCENGASAAKLMQDWYNAAQMEQ